MPSVAKSSSCMMIMVQRIPLTLAAMGIKGEKVLHPPLTSTLLRTFGASCKRSEGARQFTSKLRFWEYNLTSCKEILAEAL